MSIPLFLGIDVGSTTVKLVVLSEAGELLGHCYLRANGRPRQTLLQGARMLLGADELEQIAGVGLTGSGGGPLSRIIGGQHVNELIAQTRAVAEYHPEARTILEIGGQDSKLLSLEREPSSGEVLLKDFAMNALCAAGTGSFLDQQAERLGISIEEEFGALALQSSTPARIAGRCTVFAKSDMIHLQQQGTPLPDILAGLCLALARNFKAVIGKGKAFIPPILFQGGVAYNRAVVRAFETVLELQPGELIVPAHHGIMAALGTALITRDAATEGGVAPFRGLAPLEELVAHPSEEQESLPRLQPTLRAELGNGSRRPTDGESATAYLGIDVGSISTCLVLLDGQDHVLARRYLPTAGRPLEAVRAGLLELGAELGDRVTVAAAGVTGSGRYLTGDFVGADAVRNEITAQARAAVAAEPEVDTLFEIGGQDSKYLRLQDGAVIDFTMNHACAAGTGSFLEEQAERLRIDLTSEFSDLAFSSPAPACLGERCTVFMESDLVHHQQQGRRVPDLAAGLAYSIAQNYLNRVVAGRPIGRKVLFQGGVAWNRSVVAAFGELLGRPIEVPPNHDVTGAIGAAMLAREAMQKQAALAGDGANPPRSRFRGFDVGERTYESTTFECRACPNLCEVNRVVIAGEPPIFYGARCDRFEEAGRSKPDAGVQVPDLFAERRDLLVGAYTPPGRREGQRVGIPGSLVFHDLFPFWRTFFTALDLDLVVSDPTNPRIIRAAQVGAVAETCFPVKLVSGHVQNLLEKEIDFIFLPSVINREGSAPGQTSNQYCPYIPAAAHLVAASVDFAARGVTPLKVVQQMSWAQGDHTQLRELAPLLGISARRIGRAAQAAEQAQREFYRAVRARGAQVLAALAPGQTAVVLVGRAYNIHDPGANHDLPYKLRKLGVLTIPLDFLPLEQIDVSDRYANMFWRSGQDILAAARIIAADPRLLAIYVTNFNCGPDSFIAGFFRRLMGRKPYLELEIDDHTADAGLITRCEAFLDSVR